MVRVLSALSYNDKIVSKELQVAKNNNFLFKSSLLADDLTINFHEQTFYQTLISVTQKLTYFSLGLIFNLYIVLANIMPDKDETIFIYINFS
ncbi:hypothetical protein BpHYR1_018367 [Brachionus plicatilis]|uniref:Uncharacterized protein n=1 Tax=Brachionus plicatilis TaxID=10195 RepID=A0A3M7PB53_BRAPC|nr:hypothetical protein BpHYR1_018367 [Brachionus plicatilis]